MRPKSRLQAAVKVREVKEDRARLTLAEAQRLALEAAQAVRETAVRARADERRGGSAADWTLVESAHLRALQEARKAERDQRAATEKLGASRAVYVDARAQAEALRRVVAARRAELAELAKADERRLMDEVATILRARRYQES